MSHQSDLIAKDIHAYLKQHENKELLRFLTCGSVDDGKSTLIGRLLYDSKMVYEDQLASVNEDSKRFGTTGGKFDPALLTDGLKAEREQGITIDVAYRYFSTTRRKFIIADTPGHEQYTRNMATGASTCDLAIILVDARHGVMPQTKRHTFIASLLGIKHIVVAINKMDLVDYSQEVYDNVRQAYAEFAGKLNVSDVQFVPISALDGDNVVDKSENMPWYTGSTIMHLLETVHIASDRNFIDLRFPVQLVNRPNLDYRGFCGTISSGIIRRGDEVMALPSGKKSKVKSIVTMDGELDEAFTPQSVTVTLEDEIDVSRGDMLVHVHNVPEVENTLEAMIVWMDEKPLQTGKNYRVKNVNATVQGRVADVRYRMDINELHREDADVLQLNEIGRCVIQLTRPIPFDAYNDNRATGAIILIDPMTNNTVGAGMILERKANERTVDEYQRVRETHSAYVRPFQSKVTPDQRATTLKQKPATIWLTGLAGSGKNTVAYGLEKALWDTGHPAAVLTGGNTRLAINRDLGFTAPDRAEHTRRCAEIAKLYNDAGLITICAFLSPSSDDRAEARQIIGEDRFLEVYLSAPAEVCRTRVPEDLYSKAESGELKFFPGVTAAYDAPENPALNLPTHEQTPEESVQAVYELLQKSVLSDS